MATRDHTQRSVKAVVLAAGHSQTTRDLLLRPLAASTVVEQSLANVTAVVPREDVIIVVDERDTGVRDHLGPDWTYVVQTVQAGTGDAVRCARDVLAGFDGDVMIAYADTPMLRASSLRGLLWRHQLTGAQFSLLTAMLPDPGDYGRIVREPDGRLTGIVEAADASAAESSLHEVNVGAYVADAAILIPTLDELAAHGEHRLTELAERLIAGGGRISSFAIVDADEVQGINTDTELEAASDIVVKRLFAPSHTIETGEIAFGTGGWRALIGEAFTMHNVRRLCQAIANEITRDGSAAQGVVVGGDRRFLSEESVRCAAEVFAGNCVRTVVLTDDVPSPLVTFAVPHLGCAFGVMVTASHNPPLWNGIKLFRGDGSLPVSEQTARLQDEANALTPGDVVALDYTLARAAGRVIETDVTNAYVDAVEAVVDVAAMRAGRPLRVIVDPMYGTSQQALSMVLTDGRVRANYIHSDHNPLFGGHAPKPDPELLTELTRLVKAGRGRFDVGLANDEDADRIGVIDESGRYMTTNEVLVILYWYLHEVRGLRGGVVRNLSTTHLLDRLADRFGEDHREVPVGFKYIVAGMEEIGALVGGESSGGLTMRGYLLGKDGIFACALVCEMLARLGKPLSVLLDDVLAITGRLEQLETGVPATPQMRVEVPRRMRSAMPPTIGGVPVVNVSTMDGIKCRLADESWVLLRFSGTEPVLRMVAEAPTRERAQYLLDWVSAYATG
ncbi:MAG: NTP transferase domain-containing protein [Actinomycetia bacterium]|nr:NTP transferase domain-containing protein [Actinomycetes bacterium]